MTKIPVMNITRMHWAEGTPPALGLKSKHLV